MTPGLRQKALSIGAVLVALLVLGRGNVWLAVLFFGVALWLLGRASRRPAPAASADVSHLRSATVDINVDRRTGTVDGLAKAGPDAGTPLSMLDRQQCCRLHALSLRDDPEGARLLEAYLDRRFTGWRAERDGHGDTRTEPARSSGELTEDEAYEVLGLQRNASRQDVVRSHRAVMKRWHPDQGGTSDLAARANAAKEVLLRRR
jgi:hypothetical protein